MSASSTAPVPVPDPDSAGFWEAARTGQLAVARCKACRRWQHPPGEDCRHCGGVITFDRVSGRGRVFSFIVVRQATVPGHLPPYVVAIVELEEAVDVRVVGILRTSVDDVRIGAPVVVELVGVDGDGTPTIEFLPQQMPRSAPADQMPGECSSTSSSSTGPPTALGRQHPIGPCSAEERA